MLSKMVISLPGTKGFDDGVNLTDGHQPWATR
jgi:hypothetical protein